MSAITPLLPQVGGQPLLVVPWHLRVFDGALTYLPLLLMALLALGTWWLVKNTPMPDSAALVAPPRHEPDYTMSNFIVQRFARDGSLSVQIEGDHMSHYPDTNTFEIAAARIRAIGRDERVTLATARRALSNADGSEVQLLGGAHVVREAAGADEAIEFSGEFLHFFRVDERVRSHLPVTVRRGGSEFRADAIEYDNLARVIELKGRVRAVFAATPKPDPRAAPN